MDPPNVSPPGACTWKIDLKYEVKQRKNGKFTSNYTPSPINFATQLSLRREAPPKISPSKSAFEKCKPWGLFLGILRYFFKSAYLTNDGSD